MSRNGAGVYTLPASYLAETGDTILADQHNSPLEDLQTDANTPRPIVAGGTGASSAVSARTNLSVMSVADIQSGYVPKVATKAALSALDTASFKAAVLTETTREKLWMWKSGDFSAEEAADTDNVNYIPSDGVSTALGCWVAATGDGVTVRTIAAGGTGADNAAGARTNLGLAIGTDVQAHSAVLDATTASFTTAQETKLSGIATGADVTSATNVNAAGAVMNTDTATTDMQFVGAGSDLSIDPAKLLKRGDAADAIDAAVTPVVATRTALAAVATATHTVAYLTEAGREGTFLWDGSDLSTYVTADTQQGIYVAPASDTTGASGAWARVVPDGAWHTEWFGAETETTGAGTEPDLSGPLTAMINLANLVKARKLVFGPGMFPLDSALPAFTYVVHIVGTKSTGGKGAAPSLLYKRYAEASTTRGVLSFSDWGFIVEDINIQSNNSVDATTVGGSAISAILTVNSPAASRTFLNRVRVSMGDGANYSLYINGQTNIDPQGPSYRGTWISDCEFFGAASASISLVGVNHFFVTGTFAATSGGSGTVVLQISGTSTAYNDDIQWHGIISGKVNINWTSRSVFVSPQADNIVVDSNTTDTMWVGPRWFGTLTNNAAAGEFTFVYDGMVVASGGDNDNGWRKWGGGRIEQWGKGVTSSGSVSVTFPLAFPAGPSSVVVNPTADSGATSIGVGQAATLTTTGFLAKTFGMSTTPTVSPTSAAFKYQAIGR